MHKVRVRTGRLRSFKSQLRRLTLSARAGALPASSHGAKSPSLLKDGEDPSARSGVFGRSIPLRGMHELV
eukprot:579273-Pyramimonas_sp.AAC.1